MLISKDFLQLDDSYKVNHRVLLKPPMFKIIKINSVFGIALR